MMGYYDQTDLPFYYELAAQYATSDTWPHAGQSDTNPNRMYLFTGTSFGHIRPQDVPPSGGWPQPTIFGDLANHGVSWRYYYQDSSVYLASFSDWATLQGKVYNISHYYTDIQNPSYAALGDLHRARRAQSGLDEHPLNNIQKGAADVANIINAFLKSPAYARLGVHPYLRRSRRSLRSRAAVRRGGPGCHPTHVAARRHQGHLHHFRVACALDRGVAVLKPHYVSHVNRDYTAMLKLIETRFNIPALTARDAAQDDMTEMFDFSSAHIPTPPPMPVQPTSGVCNKNLEKAPGY